MIQGHAKSYPDMDNLEFIPIRPTGEKKDWLIGFLIGCLESASYQADGPLAISLKDAVARARKELAEL